MPLVRVGDNCRWRCVPGPPPYDTSVCKRVCPGLSAGGRQQSAMMMEEDGAAKKAAQEAERMMNEDCMCKGGKKRISEQELFGGCTVPVDYTISPRSRASIYANNRTRYAPPTGSPLFSLAALAVGDASATLIISDDAVARAFQLLYVQLDPTTPYSSIVMQVYVGENLREEFSGIQLDPATNNNCVSTACQVPICAGSVEQISIAIVNVGAAPLGDNAGVRVQGRLILQGDADFPRCWDCSQVPGAPIG